MIKRKRKNPLLHEIGGIRYEIINRPTFDEEEVIRKFSEIIDQKFKTIKNQIPLIVFRLLVARNGQFGEVLTINSRSKNNTSHFVRTICHELGHFIYRFYLSNEAINYFSLFVEKNTKKNKYSTID